MRILCLFVFAALALTNDALVRIPLTKFRTIRRQLTDSGRRVDELLADKHSLKYNFGFPSSNAPTPETLKNYLDVSITFQTTDLWTFKSSLSLMHCSKAERPAGGRATTKVFLCCDRLDLFFCKSSRLNDKLDFACEDQEILCKRSFLDRLSNSDVD